MKQNHETCATNNDFRLWTVYLICLGLALVFMFLFGLNSPIHTFNTHCDYQWFTTMGRGILAGKVPYRDLFEQKGPIIFVVFAVANLFPNPQFVVWLFEVIIVSWFLLLCYRIARKFLSPWLSLLVLPLMMALLSVNYGRGLEGSCVEEFCFPIFAYGLLCFLEFLMEHKVATWYRGLVLGICLGVLFWTKFSMLEFFLVPLLIWFVVSLIERRFKNLVKNGLLMLGGFALVSLPIIVWFVAVGAWNDLWQVYFVINLTNYSGDVQNGLYVKHVNPWVNLRQSFSLGKCFCLMVVLGLLCFVVQNWRQKSGWLLLLAGLSTWFMIGFFCGYVYYYLPMYTYAVLGLVYLVKGFEYLLKKAQIVIKTNFIKVAWWLFAVMVCLIAAFPFVTNLREINRPRNQYAQLVVADLIAEYNQTANQPATLFCYHMVDCGFYNAADIIPNVRYYAQNSFAKNEFPEMFASFDETIQNQVCDFVVMYRLTYEQNRAMISQFYHPYLDNNPAKSSIPFACFEPRGYVRNEIIILFRN